MGDSLKSNSLNDEDIEKESKIFLTSRITEIHPLAFTIEFDDQKFDESRTSRVRERLNAFSLKHKRNPSLPDFREVNDPKNSPSIKKIVSPENVQNVPVLRKRFEKSGKISEAQKKSKAVNMSKNIECKTPLSPKENLEMRDNITKCQKIGRRCSLDCVNASETYQNMSLNDTNDKVTEFECSSASQNDDIENKSDTISEAGTYTVDKENEEAENDVNKTCVLKVNEDKENLEYLNGVKANNHKSWITDWVRDVEEQNLLNPAIKGSPIILQDTEIENGSYGTSRIPSPLNTLSRKAKPRSTKSGDGNKLNGFAFHRRSSSLSAKDCNESHGCENSLETESFLKTTESLMTSMQSRMRFSLDRRSSDFRKTEKWNSNYKEHPHPPSTASDTDTNSETDAKIFKKPIGNPFTSSKLNRAFSLRRAKVNPEKDSTKMQSVTINSDTGLNVKQGPTSKMTAIKSPSSTSFSRLDCGRFSMRNTMSNMRSNLANQLQKKEMKKSNGSNRSTSSLSSREVEFQNWRRRKSFDPMKAAAEGRKKELAKKAAMNHSLAQSVNLGSDSRTRHSQSPAGNPVLRSASFHSTAQVLGNKENEKFQEQGFSDEKESASSSYFSNRDSGPRNSLSQVCIQYMPTMKTPVLSSRSSLVSETFFPPNRRFRSNDLENLVLSAIIETSHKLKLKSCKLLRKLNYLYEPSEEKSLKLRDEIAVLERGLNSSKNFTIQQATSGDLSVILKNLKALENVFSVLEDVLFDENLQVYVKK